MGIALLASGAALALTGGALLLADRLGHKKRHQAVAIAPTITDQGAFVMITGRY